MTKGPRENMARLNLEMPPASVPSANYIPWKRTGSWVYISGQVSIIPGKFEMIGKLGDDLVKQQGYEAAQAACLNAIAQLEVALDGDLSRVAGIIKLSGFVRATPDFADHPFVINGASDLLVKIFGESGRHTRFAIGVASLPRGVAVELDLVAEIAE